MTGKTSPWQPVVSCNYGCCFLGFGKCKFLSKRVIAPRLRSLLDVGHVDSASCGQSCVRRPESRHQRTWPLRLTATSSQNKSNFPDLQIERLGCSVHQRCHTVMGAASVHWMQKSQHNSKSHTTETQPQRKWDNETSRATDWGRATKMWGVSILYITVQVTATTNQKKNAPVP